MKNKEVQQMEQCMQVKQFIANNMRKYAGFVQSFLKQMETKEATLQLLPFDGTLQGYMRFLDSGSMLNNLGVSLMKMDLKPDLYSLGISFEINSETSDSGHETMIWITACKTIEELQTFVCTDDFQKESLFQFNNQVDSFFFPTNKKMVERPEIDYMNNG